MPITERTLKSTKPKSKDFFLRDDELRGFGVKVTPAGRKSFIAEGRIRGAGTKRITIGTHPTLSVSQARIEAAKILAEMQMGKDPAAVREAAKRANRTLAEAFEDYMDGKERKQSTVVDYRSCFRLVFSDWAKRPLNAITKADVEKKFRHVSQGRGERTANKAFAMLSGVCSWAMADDTIQSNPCEILKQKSLRKAPRRKTSYLSDYDVGRLINFFEVEKDFLHPTRDNPDGEQLPHGVSEQGANYIKLLLFTGLRKSEAINLRWSDVNWKEKYLLLKDTKNGREHYVPLSGPAIKTLQGQRTATEYRDSPYVFPSRHDDSQAMSEPKSQLARIKKATGLEFTLHDLRRTFATHASAQGVTHDLIKRALNHKSGDVTEGYIISQIRALRPVFQAVTEGYHDYYDPDWRADAAFEKALEEEHRLAADMPNQIENS
jgi:integrase